MLLHAKAQKIIFNAIELRMKKCAKKYKVEVNALKAVYVNCDYRGSHLWGKFGPLFHLRDKIAVPYVTLLYAENHYQVVKPNKYFWSHPSTKFSR